DTGRDGKQDLPAVSELDRDRRRGTGRLRLLNRWHNDRHERGGLRGGGKCSAERQPALPGVEGGGRGALAVAKLLDRETAVRLLPQPTTPQGFQRGIGRTRHGPTPEDERVGPPSRLSSRTRLVPASAYLIVPHFPIGMPHSLRISPESQHYL